MQKDNSVALIGLGEIGFETLKELCKKSSNIFGVDVNEQLLIKLRRLGYNVGTEIPVSEIYIVAVYTTQQVLDVLKKISYTNKPLIVIESTVMPGTYKKILQWGKQKRISFDMVLFPHRYNPGDPAHHVFNLTRVMGGLPRAFTRAIKFYRRYIQRKNIYQTTGEIAELCKPLENAYRYLEIAIAEELAMICKRKRINFKKLREACNTKWNIDIKEAKAGVGGKCLPKDMDLINTLLGDNTFFSRAVETNLAYKKLVNNQK